MLEGTVERLQPFWGNDLPTDSIIASAAFAALFFRDSNSLFGFRHVFDRNFLLSTLITDLFFVVFYFALLKSLKFPS